MPRGPSLTPPDAAGRADADGRRKKLDGASAEDDAVGVGKSSNHFVPGIDNVDMHELDQPVVPGVQTTD